MKITDEQVVELRVAYACGASQSSLAARFGVTVSSVSKIVLGKMRSDAGGPIARRAKLMGAPELDRLLAYTERTSGGCWEWTGSRNPAGYGNFCDSSGRTSRAHRRSYELHVGPIPKSLLVLHSCDNPPCVNPAHLRVGSHSDNAQDKMDRDRTLKGEAHPQSRLSEDDVLEIRRLVAEGAHCIDLASRFSVALSAIYKVATGETWAHVSGPRTVRSQSRATRGGAA